MTPNLHLIDTLKDTELPPALAAKQAYLEPLAIESFKRDLKYGLKVSFGTDAGVFPHGDNAKEFTARVKHGDTPLHAIQSATIVNADLFGHAGPRQDRGGPARRPHRGRGQSARGHRAPRERPLRHEGRCGLTSSPTEAAAERGATLPFGPVGKKGRFPFLLGRTYCSDLIA